jgi:hypothetical protein
VVVRIPAFQGLVRFNHPDHGVSMVTLRHSTDHSLDTLAKEQRRKSL